MKRLRLFLSIVFMLCLFFIFGCVTVPASPVDISETYASSSTTVSPMTAVVEQDQTFDLSPSTLTPDLPKGRLPITINDVKNITDSYKIGLDGGDTLIGLPEGISKADAELIKLYYQAMSKKFPSSDIYYSKDVISGNTAIYSFEGEVLILQTLKQEDGSYIYADFPTAFEKIDGEYKITGDYHAEILPIKSIGLMWNNAFPQFLMDKVVLSNGDTYYTKYLSYESVVGKGSPWMDISGLDKIVGMIPTPTSSDVEKVVNPTFTFSTSGEYMGVEINADLVVDSSASYKINKVTISDNDYLEYVARMFFKVWWAKGVTKHSGIPTEEDFVSFMGLWARAQETGNKEDWEQVQISDIWANDLDDGEVYLHKSYTVWPMYNGDPPSGIRGISKFSSVRVSGVGIIEDYITKYNMGAFFIGKGTHLSDGTLYVYDYCADYSFVRSVRVEILNSLSSNSWWLKLNKGRDTGASPQSDSTQFSVLERSLYVEFK